VWRCNAKDMGVLVCATSVIRVTSARDTCLVYGMACTTAAVTASATLATTTILSQSAPLKAQWSFGATATVGTASDGRRWGRRPRRHDTQAGRSGGLVAVARPPYPSDHNSTHN